MRKLVACFLFVSLPNLANASPALTVVSGTPGATAVTDTSHGWQFTANSPIVVTHLGFLDSGEDGFAIDYPIGLYRASDSTLLSSGVISAGAGDTLIDRFRYVDTPDITLVAGEEYVMAWYALERIPSDEFFSVQSITLSVDPVITYNPLRLFQLNTGGLVMPTNSTTDHRIGPNFLFLIPEPTTAALLLTFIVPSVIRRHR